MSREVPKYRRHPNGQAFVKVAAINGGKPLYLGKYGSPESKREYERAIRALNDARAQPIRLERSATPTIIELIALYEVWAKQHYTRNGIVSSEYAEMMLALRTLDDKFGSLPAIEFGPKKLREVRTVMIKERLARTVINHRISRIKRFFIWCVAEELIPGSVYHGLLAVKGLLAGMDNVHEAKDVLPVARKWVDLTIPHLSPTVAAMVQVQLWCGMRPGEVCIMRGCDIAMGGDTWIYRPYTHKNAWRLQSRVIAIPKVAQQIIKQFLRLNTQEFLFSPIDAQEWKNTHRRPWSKPDRKTPIYPSEIKARAKARANRRQQPSRLRSRYDRDSYRRAVTYALLRFRKLGMAMPHWHPHQLRHTISTEISQTIGEQAAQRWLGHERLETTGLYTEKQISELLEIAKELDRRMAM